MGSSLLTEGPQPPVYLEAAGARKRSGETGPVFTERNWFSRVISPFEVSQARTGNPSARALGIESGGRLALGPLEEGHEPGEQALPVPQVGDEAGRQVQRSGGGQAERAGRLPFPAELEVGAGESVLDTLDFQK